MKIEPVLDGIPQMFDNPKFCQNLETVAKRIPNIEEQLPKMRERMSRFAAMRAEQAKAAGQS